MRKSYKSPYKSFIFESYKFDLITKKLILNYSFDGKLEFKEIINFDFEISRYFNKQSFDKACFYAFIMSGISYFKLYLPHKIEINSQNVSQQLSKSEASFFENIYFQGLGEFFMQNNINLVDVKIKFPTAPNNTNKYFSDTIESSARSTNNLENLKAADILVALGGGKDSLTTISLLQKNNIKFSTWSVNPEKALDLQLTQIFKDLPPKLKNNIENNFNNLNIKVWRKISRNIIEENKKTESLNGHVPISAIWAFLSVCTAVLKNSKYIVLSNEHSASEPTCDYQGQKINHQFSKSLEFERDFQNLIHENISQEITYFSLLRSFTELKIARIFAENCWVNFSKTFSSCNKNFKIIKKEDPDTFSWCGNCAKCTFVFLIIAPFIQKKSMLEIFEKNYFKDPNLENFYYELLGLTDKKPFECVGEILEVRRAFLMLADERSAFHEDVAHFIEKLSDEDLVECAMYNYSQNRTNLIPDIFKLII